MSERFTIVLKGDGLHGTTEDGRHVLVGCLIDGQPAIFVAKYEGEDEDCSHCGAMWCITVDQRVERCLRCGRSNTVCDECGRAGAEHCVDCNGEWCDACWKGDQHRQECKAVTT